MMSWTEAGRNKPVDRVSERYFLRSSSRAYCSSFLLRYYYNLLAYSSASFFFGGIPIFIA